MGAKAVYQQNTQRFLLCPRGFEELVMVSSFWNGGAVDPRHATIMGKEWVEVFIMWKATWSAIRIPASNLVLAIIPPHRRLPHPSHTPAHATPYFRAAPSHASFRSNRHLLVEILQLLLREANYTIIKTDQNLFIPAHCPHCYGNSAKSSHLILAEQKRWAWEEGEGSKNPFIPVWSVIWRFITAPSWPSHRSTRATYVAKAAEPLHSITPPFNLNKTSINQNRLLLG